MNLEINQTYSFKLNSGEEMVSKVTALGHDAYELDHPVSIAQGPQGMGLVMSMMTASPQEKVWLNKSSVSLVAATEDGVRMKYLEATTGIKVPEKKLILG